MSALPGPFYRFRTDDQWRRVACAGLAGTAATDVDTGKDMGGITGCRVRTLALSPGGDLFWVADGRLLAAGREAPLAGVEGPRVGAVRRLVAGRNRLWALVFCGGEKDRRGRLVRIDAASLQVLTDAAADDVTDIALDGRDGLWVLAGDILHRIADSGAETARMDAPEPGASAVAVAGTRLALLAQDGRHVAMLDPATGAALRVNLSAFAGPGWIGEQASLSSAGDSVLVEGAVEIYSGGRRIAEPRFFLIGAGGDLVGGGSWVGDRAPSPLAASGNDLFGLFDRSGEQRVLRFEGLALAGGERRLTPALDTVSPAGRWLRAEVKARLPEHSTLTLRWVASADEGLRRLVERTLADATRPMTWRLERVDEMLAGSWSDEFTYAGVDNDGHAPLERLAFPLHDANGPILWVDLSLRRNSAVAAPEIESLLVLHEAESLMDDLPAIYSGEGDRDGTLRRLVAVLETTTQGIDYRIGGLARRLDPRRTGDRWLPGLAAMLGLPFHDALSPEMQRGLVAAAPSILARRGTRRGLVDMVEALFPGRPIRVTDRTEQLVPIALGRGAAGRSLPALLSGPSIRVPKLNARLVLNKTALCRTNACSDAQIAPPPQVLIAIPASRDERLRYGEAVASMARAMIPAGVKLRLNWIPWRGGSRPVPDGVMTIIEPPGRLGLGDGPGLGRGRIGGRAGARLDGHGVTPAEHRLL